MGHCTSKQPIEDIGEVAEHSESDEKQHTRYYEADIDSVLTFMQFRQCKVCKSKIEIVNEHLGTCSKCSATSKLTKCPQTSMTKVIITTKNDHKHTLTIFDPVLTQILNTVDSNG